MANDEINDQNTVSVTIRMDAAIHQAVKNVADAQYRSLTKQIEMMLRLNPDIQQQLETATAAKV